jgi:hypothetical protein
MNAKDREREFLTGAPLAVVSALCLLPAIVFLVVVPRFQHGRAAAVFVLPACALAGGLGLWKLAAGVVRRPWGVLNFLSVGVLLILLVIAAYTGWFLALLTLQL